MTSLSIPCPSYDLIYRSGSHRFCAELDKNLSVFDKTGAFGGSLSSKYFSFFSYLYLDSGHDMLSRYQAFFSVPCAFHFASF